MELKIIEIYDGIRFTAKVQLKGIDLGLLLRRDGQNALISRLTLAEIYRIVSVVAVHMRLYDGLSAAQGTKFIQTARPAEESAVELDRQFGLSLQLEREIVKAIQMIGLPAQVDLWLGTEIVISDRIGVIFNAKSQLPLCPVAAE